MLINEHIFKVRKVDMIQDPRQELRELQALLQQEVLLGVDLRCWKPSLQVLLAILYLLDRF